MSRRPTFVAAAIVLVCVAGCSRTVGGSAVVASESRDLATIPLPELMLEPSAFPPEYPAASLDASAAQSALALVDGVPPGGRVTPPECQPAAPRQIAATEGVHGDTTLRVMLARGVGPLSARRDQVAWCSTFSVTTDTNGSWDVSAQLLPPPVLDVDDAFAVEQTQTGSGVFGGLALVGQVSEVRVIAQLTGLPGQQLDTAVLDQVFAAAVQKVRHAA